MTETFVDLTYRGLSLGRRIKLAQIHPTTGYLEHPTPMPVGTSVSVATDDGIVLDAIVTKIHEQVGGSEVAPGMQIRPTFATEQIESWWKARATAEPVTAPPPTPSPPPTPPERSRPITVRPRTHTTPEPLPTPGPAATLAATGIVSPAGLPVPDGPTTIPGTVFNPADAAVGGTATMVMNAVDQDLLAQLTKNDEVEQITRTTGEYEVVDDGMRTTMMDAVDPAALGLDVSMLSSSSGSMAAVDDENGDDDEPSAADSSPSVGGAPKSKKKKRKRR